MLSKKSLWPIFWLGISTSLCLAACVSGNELTLDTMAETDVEIADPSIDITDPSIDITDTDAIDYSIAEQQAFDPSGIIINFEFNKSTLTPEGIKALNLIVAGLKKDPLAMINVRGHADKQ